MDFGVEELRRLRSRLSMTQRELAALIGVSQAAVAQYEAGSREPAGQVRGFYERLGAADTAPVVVEALGRRTTTLPVGRWERVVDPGRVSVIELPVRLDWSPRESAGWVYGDEVHRRELYRIVLDVGDALDVRVFVDPDELVAWHTDLLVARAVRPALDRLVERLTQVPAVA
ncbi:MAG TPA: helix-turn-helix transcriptional regulator [Ilumatobacter sp.]|nr:helix-turn-helix transcriptional regulator [Ilumatobacter sp.]